MLLSSSFVEPLISIHAPHARSDSARNAILRGCYISIHAPHARSDSQLPSSSSVAGYFNPRSSCEERREAIPAANDTTVFQSTLLMRGATTTGLMHYLGCDISIHAPHARSDYTQAPALPDSLISIHAPHARSDTRLQSSARPWRQISIHAPHARSDSSQLSMSGTRVDFNPRSSCEERRSPSPQGKAANTFQSTLLMRGATGLHDIVYPVPQDISIHAPHARSDSR